MDKNKLEKLVEDTINSMNTADRAMPAPFLLTRIRTKMDREGSLSVWEKLSAFLARPMVAFPVLVMVLVLNFWIITSSVTDNSNSSGADYSKVSTDEYSLSTATSLSDFENGQR